MSRSNRYARLLGAVTFPLVSYGAITAIFPHILHSGVTKLGAQCTPTSTAGFLQPYTGITALDDLLCVLASFFGAALATPSSARYVFYLGVHLAPITLIPLVIANRPGRSLLLAFPVVFGLLYQRFTAGVIMPLLYFLEIASGSAALTGAQAIVPKLAAESIHFALVVGFLIPSGIMMLYPTIPRVLAYWQLFPIYLTITQYAYRTLFSSRAVSRTGSASGTKALQGVFIHTFILSAVVHWWVLAPLFGDAAALKAFFFPPLTPDPTDAVIGALNTLQWDGVFFWGSTMLASLWWTRSAGEATLMALWNVITTVLFGPGAAISGAAFWREATLQQSASKSAKKD